jgi:CDP-diacylglycerol--glycerol-3-phosphate 3-phosphatidyltransferase
LFEYGMLLTACLLLAGVAGRIAALVLIGLQGFYYLIHPFDIVASIVLISAIWLLLLGTGRYSLWRRDEDWVNRYDGG